MTGRRGKEAASLKTIPLVPTKSQINSAIVGITVLGTLALLIPGFFFIAAFVMPVLVCPLLGRADKKTAVSLVVFMLIPAASSFIQTNDWLLALAVLCTVFAPAVVTRILLSEKPALGLKNQKQYLAAYVFSVLMLLLWLSHKFSGGIIQGMLTHFCAWLESLPYKASLMEYLVYGGFLPEPSAGLAGSEAERELMLLLGTRLEEGLMTALPKVITWTPLIASLFTLLRVTWANGSFLLLRDENQKEVTVARPVIFSMLALRWRTVFWLIAVEILSALILLPAGGAWEILGGLVFWSCMGIHALAGTASFLRMIKGQDKRPSPWKGLLAGIMLVMCYEVMVFCLPLEYLFIATGSNSSENNKEEEQ